MGLIGGPGTSVTNQTTTRNILEEERSQPRTSEKRKYSIVSLNAI
jgi:hypothetical protein